MSIILASRGVFTQATYELLQVLPLAVGDVVAMTISSKRHTVLPHKTSGESNNETASRSVDFSDIHSIRSFTSSLESGGIRSEGIVKSGSLVNEVSSTAVAKHAGVIILVEEVSRSSKLKLLASDGLAVLRKTGKPVLLQPDGCAARSTGSILVAMSGVHHSPQSRWHLERILNLAGREAVVLSVSSPYYPVFGKVSLGMRAYQSEALHEIWAEQAGQGVLPAGLLAGRLKDAGAKSWFVSRTGRFVDEVVKTAQSAQASLACILVDQTIRRRWFGRSELADLLEVLSVPVMLVPCERSLS